MSSQRILAIDVYGAFGGAQRSFAALLRGLHSSGRELFCASASPVLRENLHAAGLVAEALPPVHWRRDLPGFIRAVRDLFRYRRWLAETCRRIEPSLIYANGLYSALLMTGYPDAPPLIFHHRDCRCLDWLLKRAMEPAERTIVLSDFMMDEVRQSMPTYLHSRLKRVYNGFDFSELAATVPEELPAAMPRLLLVADLVDWKRHELFLETLAKLATRCPNVRGFVIGGERDREGRRLKMHLQMRSKALGVQEIVDFLGPLPSALPYIKAADVLCSTSTAEPFGRTIVEAVALGTPVVATVPGGPAEILKGVNDCLCVPADPGALAEAVERVSGKRVKPTAGWINQFSIEQHVKQINETIAAVLDA